MKQQAQQKYPRSLHISNQARVVEADPDFVFSVVSRMRERDFQELRATSFAQTRHRLALNLAQMTAHPMAGSITHGVAWRGKPAAVAGAVEFWPGVWSAWMVATDDWSQVAQTLTKWIIRETLPAAWKAGAHRIEARSMADYTQAHKWMQVLGAREEAVLAGFGRHGEDFKVFVWRRYV